MVKDGFLHYLLRNKQRYMGIGLTICEESKKDTWAGSGNST